ncbi:MAG: 6-phosphofructokinase [Bacillota bacterium]
MIPLTLKGNCLIAQSGGPTAVINNSICGLIKGSLRYNNIQNIYGSLFGIKGVFNEELIDLRQEKRETIDGLRFTPGPALGSCRHKIKDDDYERLLSLFKRYNIRYFFYVGGNDSMDTANKIHKLAQDTRYDLQVIGVPKTVDNDLSHTDHCPGYGSAAKYAATVVMETGIDLQGILASSDVVITEIMGRNAGWLPAATALAKNNEEDAPNLIYVPEVPFDKTRFLADVEKVYKKLGYVYIVVSEGIRDAEGNYLAAEKTKDAFGHVKLGNGAANALKDMINEHMQLKIRCNILGSSQRSAMHYASRVDASEAYMVGAEAVKLASRGLSGVMVTLERSQSDIYYCKTGYVELQKVANHERKMPLSMINKEYNFVTQEFIAYARPLIEGNVSVPMKRGLPDYVVLDGYKKYNSRSRKPAS